jgi:hypothetical protein
MPQDPHHRQGGQSFSEFFGSVDRLASHSC